MLFFKSAPLGFLIQIIGKYNKCSFLSKVADFWKMNYKTYIDRKRN